MNTKTKYEYIYWGTAAARSCRELGWMSAKLTTFTSKSAWNEIIADLQEDGFVFDNLPSIKNDYLSNIKSVIDWYIDSRAWEHDPALMPENTSDAVREYYIKLHELMWTFIGGSAIAFCIANDINVSDEGIANTLVKKQKDYGPKNISRFGLNGLVIRTHDKIARIENLLSKPDGVKNAVENESVYDTLLDIGGYAAIALMWNRGTFLLPLNEDE